MDIEQAKLYFIPSRGEFLKIQPGTGDNLSPEDIAEGYTDYVIWNRFRPECLDIDGELPMECVDSGIVLLKGDPGSVPGMTTKVEAGMNPTFPIHDVLGKVLSYAYGENAQKSRATRTLVFVLPRRMGVRLRLAPGAIPLLW